MNAGRLENIFGAVVLAGADGIRQGAEQDVAHRGETPAALNLIGHVPDISIDGLASGLNLSHPGTVRLVDRLALDGFVTRTPSRSDRRSVELRLTPRGNVQRRRLLGRRRRTIEALLAALSLTERKQLEAISVKLLRAHVATVPDALATCRFCDERTCCDCPVNAALEASA